MVVSYLEAVKLYPIDSEISPDWQILERLFLNTSPDGRPYQENFNLLYSNEEAEAVLVGWLKDIGYDDVQIKVIQEATQSSGVRRTIEMQEKIVEESIRTIKIPTIIFDGRRYDRVIGEENLK